MTIKEQWCYFCDECGKIALPADSTKEWGHPCGGSLGMRCESYLERKRIRFEVVDDAAPSGECELASIETYTLFVALLEDVETGKRPKGYYVR